MNCPSNENAVFVYITRAFWFVLFFALLKINGILDCSWRAVTFVFWGPLVLLQVMFACCTIYLCAKVTFKGLHKTYRQLRFHENTKWSLDMDTSVEHAGADKQSCHSQKGNAMNTSNTIGHVVLHVHGGNIQEDQVRLIKNPDDVREQVLEEIEREFLGDCYANPEHPDYTDKLAREMGEEYTDKRENARNLRRVDLDEDNEIIVLEIVEDTEQISFQWCMGCLTQKVREQHEIHHENWAAMTEEEKVAFLTEFSKRQSRLSVGAQFDECRGRGLAYRFVLYEMERRDIQNRSRIKADHGLLLYCEDHEAYHRWRREFDSITAKHRLMKTFEPTVAESAGP